jgi:hypothetical protein
VTIIFTPANLTATPTISPAGGLFTSDPSVTLACASPGASIYYTLNGSTPNLSSTLYTGPVTLIASCTLQAIAIAPGMGISMIGSASFTINSSGTPGLVLLTPTTLPNAQQGFLYQLALPIVLGTAPYTGSIVSQSGANAGAWGMGTNGLFNGTPMNAGTDTVVVNFSDSTTPTPFTTGNITLTITTSAISTGSLSTIGAAYTAPAATAGGVYILELAPLISSVNIGTPPYFWQAGTGSVTGASGTIWQSQVSYSESLQGAPAAGVSGNDVVNMTVTDSAGLTGTIAITIPINSALSIQGVPPGSTSGQAWPQGMVGNVYGSGYFGHPLVAAGGNAPYTWSATGMAPGLSINGNIIVGTPTVAGTYHPVVTCTPASGSPVSYTFTHVISPSLNVSVPAWCTGSNAAFFTKSGQIYDYTGAPFRGRGLNIAHFNQNWHSGTPANPNGLAATRSNIGRIFCAMYYGSWASMGSGIGAVTAYASVVVPTISFTNGYFGSGTPPLSTTNNHGLPVLQDAVYQIVQGAPTLLPYNDTMFLCPANEWGGPGSWDSTWANAMSGVAATAVASVSGTTITLAVGPATNPFADACIGYLKTSGQYVAITGTGGSAGTGWTVTSYSTLTTTSADSMVGGPIGVFRALGFTCPIWIDNANGSPYNQASLMQQILASDPLNNVIFNAHYYGNLQPTQCPITGITQGSTTTVAYTYPAVFTDNVATNPFRPASAPFSNYWTGAGIAGLKGTTVLNTTFAIAPQPQSGGSYTVSVPINTNGQPAWTGGGWIYNTLYPQYQIAQWAALANAGIPVMIGEFADCSPPQAQTATTWTTGGMISQWAEANQLGWVYWAMDDNGGSGQGSFQIADGAGGGVGVYSKPTDLLWHGVDIVLHPTHGITALATPASGLLGP